MRTEAGLYQEQRRKLLVTPELKQSLQILQYSSLQLNEYVQQRALENPLIRLDESRLSSTTRRSGGHRGSLFNPIDKAAAPGETLEACLLEQLSCLAGVSREHARIAAFIIGNLDSRGYLDISIEEMSSLLRADEADALQALKIVQSFEPYGVGARNLQECLLIQLERLGGASSLAYRLVKEFLPQLAEGKLERIAAELRVDADEVRQALDRIRALNPRPGSSYAPEDISALRPDAVVERIGKAYVVAINDSLLPRIGLDRELCRLRPDGAEARKYVQEKLKEARWLARSLERRNAALYSIIECIVHKQARFFDYGVRGLQPLTLSEVAERLDVHESTVSRAIAGKYVQTPRGTFELKYFFASSLRRPDGEAVSSVAVKERIRTIVAGENKRKPLSDQRIARLLEEEGVAASRRTVAKYREALGIPNSTLRRRFQ